MQSTQLSDRCSILDDLERICRLRDIVQLDDFGSSDRSRFQPLVLSWTNDSVVHMCVGELRNVATELRCVCLSFHDEPKLLRFCATSVGRDEDPQMSGDQRFVRDTLSELKRVRVMQQSARVMLLVGMSIQMRSQEVHRIGSMLAVQPTSLRRTRRTEPVKRWIT